MFVLQRNRSDRGELESSGDAAHRAHRTGEISTAPSNSDAIATPLCTYDLGGCNRFPQDEERTRRQPRSGRERTRLSRRHDACLRVSSVGTTQLTAAFCAFATDLASSLAFSHPSRLRDCFGSRRALRERRRKIGHALALHRNGRDALHRWLLDRGSVQPGCSVGHVYRCRRRHRGRRSRARGSSEPTRRIHDVRRIASTYRYRDPGARRPRGRYGDFVRRRRDQRDCPHASAFRRMRG